MITEGSEPEDPKRDDGDDPPIDQQPENQALVQDREKLPPLAHQSEPLRPCCDESGRWCVHRAEPASLAGFLSCLPGSGASGSFFARRTVFVTGLAAARSGLSTVFFCAGFAAATGFSV